MSERDQALAEARREIDGIIERVGLNTFLDMAALPQATRRSSRDPLVVYLWVVSIVAVSVVGAGCGLLVASMARWSYIGTFGMGVAYFGGIAVLLAANAFITYRAVVAHRHVLAAAVWPPTLVALAGVMFVAWRLTMPVPGHHVACWNAIHMLVWTVSLFLAACLTITACYVASCDQYAHRDHERTPPCGWCSRPMGGFY